MIKVGSIVIDCKDFNKMSTFWREALHYEVSKLPDPGDTEPFSILRDKTGSGGPNVSIDRMEPLRGKIHLDLYTDDPNGEIERLLKIGAKVYKSHEPETDFTILEDPEGNLFCIVDVRES